MHDPRDPFSDSEIIGNYINTYFSLEQGVRMGESTVLSRYVHRTVSGKYGHIRVLTNLDAGQYYLHYLDAGHVAHLSIYHTEGDIQPELIARLIYRNIRTRLLAEDAALRFDEEGLDRQLRLLTEKILVITPAGTMLVCDFTANPFPLETGEQPDRQCVHILFRAQSDQYSFVLPIIGAAEEAIVADGVQLARVKRLSHGKEKRRSANYAGFTLPWSAMKGSLNERTLRTNQEHLLVKMAEKLGGIQAAEEFLENYLGNVLRRKSKEEQARKFGDIAGDEEQLETLGILKKGLLGTSLTTDGKRLLQFANRNRCELEAAVRRSMKKSPHRSGRTRLTEGQPRKPARKRLINRNKVVRWQAGGHSGEISAYDTVVSARISSMVRGDRRLAIRPEDVRVYGRRTQIPLNICLLMDGSASMSGEKWRASCYLAEHLLLTSKDKVSVVIFMNNQARIVAPFTRDHRRLALGLGQISPNGLTPLADGIVKAVEMIRKAHLPNTVLVLITDGLPTGALWSFDAGKDALQAARLIAQKRIQLICIGVAANEDYLKELTRIGRGRLHTLEDFNRDSLVAVMDKEKRARTRRID